RRDLMDKIRANNSSSSLLLLENLHSNSLLQTMTQERSFISLNQRVNPCKQWRVRIAQLDRSSEPVHGPAWRAGRQPIDRVCLPTLCQRIALSLTRKFQHCSRSLRFLSPALPKDREKYLSWSIDTRVTCYRE